MATCSDRRARARLTAGAVLACALFLSVSTAAEGPPRFHVDGWLGWPRLETDALALEGGGSFAWRGDALEITVGGAMMTFGVLQDGREQTNASIRAGGGLTWLFWRAGWIALGALVDGGFAQESADSLIVATGVTSLEEASQMLRVHPGVLLRLRSPQIDVEAVAAVGVQREAYLRQAVTGAGTLDDATTETVTLSWRGGARGRWHAVQEILDLGLDATALGSNITRSVAMFRFDPGATFEDQRETALADRLELSARVAAEIVALRLLHIAPFVYGQFRYVRTTAGGSTVAIGVPSLGAGLAGAF